MAFVFRRFENAEFAAVASLLFGRRHTFHPVTFDRLSSARNSVSRLLQSGDVSRGSLSVSILSF
jgi:hypothetical protein